MAEQCTLILVGCVENANSATSQHESIDIRAYACQAENATGSVSEFEELASFKIERCRCGVSKTRFEFEGSTSLIVMSSSMVGIVWHI